MNELIAAVASTFQQRFGAAPTFYSQSPGRINIIGEHTDYTGGLSLPAAIDRWTVAAWRPRADDRLRIYSENMGELWDTSWGDLPETANQGWKKYVGGALLLFRESHLGREPHGLDLAITGNVPLGKGVSSSAAIELAILNGLTAVYDKPMAPVTLAQMAQQVEHRFLKLKSGLLDQFACQFSKQDSALLIDFSSLETRPAPSAPIFRRMAWVLVDSLVKRELTGSKYSERVEEYLAIQKILAAQGKTLRGISSREVPALFASAPENLLRRARHIVSENERTLEAVDKLKLGDVEGLGRLLRQTHISLAQDYEVSHPNLDFLVATACESPGVCGGRMMGGGFGGCALFLVHAEAWSEFAREISAKYEAFSGLKTEPWSVRFVDGASAWRNDGR
jgi:galactokinase